MEQLDYYGYSGDRVKGLVFCSRKEEGLELAEKFRQHGIRAKMLSGDRSYNKDTMRRYVSEGARIIPGSSTIHFRKLQLQLEH